MKIASGALIAYHPIWCFIHITHPTQFAITHDFRKKNHRSFGERRIYSTIPIFGSEIRQHWTHNFGWCIVINFWFTVPSNHSTPNRKKRNPCSTHQTNGLAKLTTINSSYVTVWFESWLAAALKLFCKHACTSPSSWALNEILQFMQKENDETRHKFRNIPTP